MIINFEWFLIFILNTVFNIFYIWWLLVILINRLFYNIILVVFFLINWSLIFNGFLIKIFSLLILEIVIWFRWYTLFWNWSRWYAFFYNVILIIILWKIIILSWKWVCFTFFITFNNTILLIINLLFILNLFFCLHFTHAFKSFFTIIKYINTFLNHLNDA